MNSVCNSVCKTSVTAVHCRSGWVLSGNVSGHWVTEKHNPKTLENFFFLISIAEYLWGKTGFSPKYIGNTETHLSSNL